MELEPKPINNGDPGRLHFQVSHCEKVFVNEEKVMGENPEEDKSPHKKKNLNSNESQTTKTKSALVRGKGKKH